VSWTLLTVVEGTVMATPVPSLLLPLLLLATMAAAVVASEAGGRDSVMGKEMRHLLDTLHANCLLQPLRGVVSWVAAAMVTSRSVAALVFPYQIWDGVGKPMLAKR